MKHKKTLRQAAIRLLLATAAASTLTGSAIGKPSFYNDMRISPQDCHRFPGYPEPEPQFPPEILPEIPPLHPPRQPWCPPEFPGPDFHWNPNPELMRGVAAGQR